MSKAIAAQEERRVRRLRVIAAQDAPTGSSKKCAKSRKVIRSGLPDRPEQRIHNIESRITASGQFA